MVPNTRQAGNRTTTKLWCCSPGYPNAETQKSNVQKQKAATTFFPLLFLVTQTPGQAVTVLFSGSLECYDISISLLKNRPSFLHMVNKPCSIPTLLRRDADSPLISLCLPGQYMSVSVADNAPPKDCTCAPFIPLSFIVLVSVQLKWNSRQNAT